MGESFGMYKMGLDEEVIKYISSANIACGFHAGDPMWMRHTVKLAEDNDVAIGAHPSFPDLIGFGRRHISVSPEEAKADIIYQIGALRSFTNTQTIQHVKPHGAMYNQAVNDEPLARAICEAVLEVDPSMILVTLSGSPWTKLAKDMGVRVAQEIFADRALNSDGSLVPRSQPGAVIENIQEVTDRSLKMVTDGLATTIDGDQLEVVAESLCIHGDTPGAVKMAESLHRELINEGVCIVPLNQKI